MSSGLSHRRRLSLGLAVALLTAGCSTSSMIPIATPSEFVPAPPVNSPKLPDGSVATPLSGGIQPDLVCAVPQESFNVFEAVGKRFGTEAGARLQRLLETDFKKSNLTPKDRELLKFIARETLWIPTIIKKWLGDALFSAIESTLVPIDEGLEKERAFAAKTLNDIVVKAPKTPFPIELMVLQSGTPSGMVGGRVFIDLDTVNSARLERRGSAHKDELAFVYAHELAHIYKRHKTKRLQEQLISIDEARKMVGILVNSRNAVTDLPSLIKTVVNIKTIASALRAHQANFLRSQEVEADSCAAALLVGNRLGDPLRGFDSYTSVHGKKSEAAKIDADHPPDAERRRVIEYVAKSGASLKPVPLENVRSNLLRHIHEAAKRDVFKL